MMKVPRVRVCIGALALLVLLGCIVQSAAAVEDYEFVTKWGSYGSTTGPVVSSEEIAVDAAGNVYVFDAGRCKIMKLDAAGVFVTEWGSKGSGDGQFIDPGGIAVDASGNVYVSDREVHRVQKFDADGTFLTKWGSRGTADGEFNSPRGITVDSAGTVYVADTGNERVQTFTSDGAFTGIWGTPGTGDGQLHYARHIAFDGTGSVFVVDYGEDSPRVQKFTSNGTFLTTWGSAGSGDGQFSDLSGIAVDIAGNVYVVDSQQRQVQKFDGNGTFLTKWGSEGYGDGQFIEPIGIAVSAAGTVYVTDTRDYRIQTFTTNGAFTGSSDDWPPLPGIRFNGPEDVAVDAAGNVYVADSGNHRVQKFTSDGTFVTMWGSEGSGDGQFDSPRGIAVDGTGTVWVTDSGNGRVQTFTPDGTFIATWGTPGTGDGQLYRPGPIAFDALGNVFIADQLPHQSGWDWDPFRIKIFGPDGSFVGVIAEVVDCGGITVDPANIVHVADCGYTGYGTGNIGIYAITPDGTPIGRLGEFGTGDNQFYTPTGVATDSAGDVYIVDYWLNRVQKFGANGALVTTWGSGGSGDGQFSYPTDIEVDGSGNVYVVDSGNDRVQKFASVTPKPPVAAFTANATSGTPPLAVLFTDDSTNSPTAWAWEFGDGATSGEQNPVHVYSTIGSYTVNLTATNADGDNSTSRAGYVTVNLLIPPVAAFSANTTVGKVPLTVAFTDVSTNTPSGWLWAFGDGGTASVPNPIHVYSAAGTYTVALTATNGDGSNSTTKIDYITVDPLEPPVAGFTANTTVGKVPLTVLFTDASTNAPTGWSWVFGDGGTANVQNPVHVYSAAGTYTVILTATNGDGSNSTTKTDYITVGPLTPPMPGFTANVTAGKVPLAVAFTDTSTNTPTGWLWVFGDGGTASVQNPVHVYSAVGTYTVTLAAMNGDGSNSTTKTGYITIGPLTPPVAGFTANVTAGKVPLTVAFTDTSMNTPTGWLWAFGDGRTAVVQNPVHVYSAAGTYTVALAAMNGDGSNSTTKTGYITVTLPSPPIAAFSANVTSGTAPLTVQFTDESMNSPTAWAWMFGDNATSTEQNPVHVYSTAGSYTVNLTASNADGSSTATRNITVTAALPSLLPVSPSTAPPTDTNGDGLYDDVNGNGRADFADVVLYFNQMSWIAANEPISAFDYNGNGRIDFADVVWLFNHL